jgi:hypothetical protein
MGQRIRPEKKIFRQNLQNFKNDPKHFKIRRSGLTGSAKNEVIFTA